MRRRPIFVALATLAVTGLAATSGASLATVAAPSATLSCPAGKVLSRDATFAQVAGSAQRTCVALNATAENNNELLAANDSMQVRHQGNFEPTADAYASAVAQAQAISTLAKYTSAPWTFPGKDALYADDPAYSSTSGEGFHNLSGRIQSFTYNPSNVSQWWAGVANGGVWESDNAGATWHSDGEALPTQIVGAIAYDKGVLLAGTGDPAFGGDSYSGLGGYYSTDNGATWIHSTGIPNGTITFRVAVDPTNYMIVYQATGKGLWRSTDEGKTYTNVVLPTTCTNINDPTCFFANIVSDVIVKPAHGGGTSAADLGGEVMAAVGWRAGTLADAVGKPQAPQDGIYTSPNGMPGTFTFTNPSTTGFPSVQTAGRTALGEAIGASQDHNYIYALVENPQEFNGQTGVGNLPILPAVNNVPVVPNVIAPSVLNGVYASPDFGKTWTLMADSTQLEAPYHGSALGGTECVLGYCAGVQSWYNEWIQPDPSSNLTSETGVPDFLAFGLEEVWGGSAAIPAVADTSDFGVFGRYFSGSTCLALSLPLQGFCPTTSGTTQQGSTVHPDQHAVMYVPDATGNLDTIVVGNDGGAYSQHNNGKVNTAASLPGTTTPEPYDNDHWANGINHDLSTLLPYDAEMSKDGTIFGGLQDNGELKISPDGTQNSVYGGDGFFSAVDPNNSKNAFEEYADGDVSVTSDGGASWLDVQPCYTSAQFSTPFQLDPINANHIVVGGNYVEESTAGVNTTSPGGNTVVGPDKAVYCSANTASIFASSTDWKPVFGLGTTNGYDNTVSALDVAGPVIYAGFCGSCDIVTQGLPFQSGLATNEGGTAPPKEGTTQGWHKVAAKGLPNRIINSVTIDPTDPKTIYVTLGGYGRRWIPPGSLGDSVANVGTGHLFVSHDAGATFSDISGNLPDAAADYAVVHQGDLIVATDVGVFGEKGKAGGTFSQVGTGLPNVPVVHLVITPRSPNELLAATYGRGAAIIELGAGSAPAGGTSGREPVGFGKSVGSGTKGTIASTGLDAAIPTLALLAVLTGVVLRRRRHTRQTA